MKRFILVLLSLLMLVTAFSGCSKKEKEKEKSVIMPTTLNTVEYTLYQNIFYNDQASQYAGKETQKEGTFTTVYDAYNDITRYYVWGYNDNTKCCDWQWELKIEDTKDLPVNGALVEVSGTYEENSNALDGFWIVNPEIKLKTNYVGNNFDVDMLSMSNTLERVQITNVIDFSEKFDNKTIAFYGRVKNNTEIEDPYYDNSWSIKVSGDYELPAFGTTVIVNGKIKDGCIVDAKLLKNTQY